MTDEFIQKAAKQITNIIDTLVTNTAKHNGADSGEITFAIRKGENKVWVFIFIKDKYEGRIEMEKFLNGDVIVTNTAQAAEKEEADKIHEALSSIPVQ